MAIRIWNLSRLNAGMASLLLRNTMINGPRTLYTDQNLGLDGYQRVRGTFRQQFTNVDELFRKKMAEVCEDDTSMVFTEDLKAMLHLAQKRPEDMDLLNKMITKFNLQSKEMRFGTYVFGPVVMRTLYFLDEPDLALSAFHNPELEGFFSQFTSYKVLLTLLYKHGRYEDMKTVYNVIKKKIHDGGGNPRQSLLLIIAACYKQNTQESYHYALDTWKDYSNEPQYVPIRAVCLLATLAINQNAPHVGIELISVIREQRLPGTRNIKVLAFSKLKRFDEIIPIFRRSVDLNRTDIKEEYYHDVITQLKESLQGNETPQAVEVQKLLQQLQDNNQIAENKVLEDFLNQPLGVAIRSAGADNSFRPGFNQNFNQNNRQNFNQNNFYQNNNMWGPRRRGQPAFADNRRNRVGMRDFV